MATDLLAEVVFASDDDAVDGSTDRWCFHSGAGSILTSAIDTLLQNFYNHVPTGGVNRISDYFSSAIKSTSGATQTRYYDIGGHLDGSRHGPPISTTFWTLASQGSAALPAQLAIVSDLHADLSGTVEFGPGGTRPRARKRGRHYFGPLSSNAVSNGAGGVHHATVAITCQNDIQKAYKDVLANVPVGVVWGVWSRKDAAIYPIVAGWTAGTVYSQRRLVDAIGNKLSWP